MIYLGVDPGASGGLCTIDSTGDVLAVSMPTTDPDIWEWLSSYAQLPLVRVDKYGEPETVCHDQVFGVIEKVGGYIGGGMEGGKGGGAANGSAMFKFGRSAGLLAAFLVAAEIPYEEVTPQRWQKALGIPPRKHSEGETKSQFKRRLKAHAQRLFPKAIITLATADAILLAEYARRYRTYG